jgi:hypothetical protein
MPSSSDDISGIVPRQRSNGSKKRQLSHEEISRTNTDDDVDVDVDDDSDDDEKPLAAKKTRD